MKHADKCVTGRQSQYLISSVACRHTGYRILWLSPCDTYIDLRHYFANPKFSQKCHFIAVGLSRLVKKYHLKRQFFWPGPEVVTISYHNVCTWLGKNNPKIWELFSKYSTINHKNATFQPFISLTWQYILLLHPVIHVGYLFMSAQHTRRSNWILHRKLSIL